MLALLLLTLLQAPPTTQTDPLAPLMVYNGTWTVHTLHPFGDGPQGVDEKLESHCTRGTAFVSCEQVINGKSVELIVYVPGEHPGEFYTKTVMPSGLSTDRAVMTISGSRWTYIAKAVQGGKTTTYRTENYFEGKDNIRFEEWESTDGTMWTKTNEGHETRVKV
jgi:hypothetical protein